MNERSAMKVNTDGVLLGAAMTLHGSENRLLDIGTGTGTIALMAAQRLSGLGNKTARITAIDIDKPSAEEAGENFQRSPWPEMLEAYNLALEDFRTRLCSGTEMTSPGSGRLFDVIFSNPPYFDDSLKAPDRRRNAARHSGSLSYREIMEFAATNLTADGHLSLIIPADEELRLRRYAGMNGLYLFRILRIRTVPRKKPSRIIAEFSFGRTAGIADSTLTIHDEGQYTREYTALTSDFYIK